MTPSKKSKRTRHVHRWGKWVVKPDQHHPGMMPFAYRVCECAAMQTIGYAQITHILNAPRPRYRRHCERYKVGTIAEKLVNGDIIDGKTMLYTRVPKKGRKP